MCLIGILKKKSVNSALLSFPFGTIKEKHVSSTKRRMILKLLMEQEYSQIKHLQLYLIKLSLQPILLIQTIRQYLIKLSLQPMLPIQTIRQYPIKLNPQILTKHLLKNLRVVIQRHLSGTKL